MQLLKRWWDISGDWLNVEMFRVGDWDIRRLDVLMTIVGFMIFFFYWWEKGWPMAVISTLSYIMVWMITVWMF
jgi:uncharacterized protein YybS (DUF2232 family)